ncbi:MAG: tetratricopeptide repeat protein [Acidobacteriota bacterium]|nr:tetratricopeptide repeat protein [Acidobacteriota bacterium]
MPPRERPVWIRLAMLAVLLATAAVYLQTLEYEFVYDDYPQIVETSQFNSWRMVPHYFTGNVWAWKRAYAPTPYYRPLFLVSLLIQQKLFGLDAMWWHLTSVALHLLVTLLVYFLARRLTDDWRIGVLAAAVFGLHPVHIESVAWVSAINEPVTAAAVVGSFLCHLRPGRLWLAASLALYAVALLTKENALALLPLLWCYEWLQAPGKRFWERLKLALGESLPHLVVTLLFLGIRYKVMGYFSLGVTPMSWRTLIMTWPEVLVFYARHLMWPSDLSVFNDMPLVTAPDLRHFILPCLILAGIAAGLWWWGRKWRLAGFCTMWMLLSLLPVLNLRLFPRAEVAHDRYLYLPSISFAILAAAALNRLRPRALQTGAAALILAAMAFGTVRQSGQWENNPALFQRGIEVAPQNHFAWLEMGSSMMLQRRAGDALPYYQKAIELWPEMYGANYLLGRCYYQLGSYLEAERYLSRATERAPLEAAPHLYFGLSELRLGRLDAAESAVRHAIELRNRDEFRDFYFALGMVLSAKGDSKGAIEAFEREARENPEPQEALEQIERLRAR